MKKKCNIFYGILQARVLEWVVFPFSRGSSQLWDQTQVSHIAGGFFTSWATTKSPRIQKGVGYPFSSGSSLPRNQTQTPELQAESLPTELSGKPLFYGRYSLKMYEQLRRRHRGNKLKLNWVGYRLTQRHWLRQFSFLEINWISFIISSFINLWNLHI